MPSLNEYGGLCYTRQLLAFMIFRVLLECLEGSYLPGPIVVNLQQLASCDMFGIVYIRDELD